MGRGETSTRRPKCLPQQVQRLDFRQSNTAGSRAWIETGWRRKAKLSDTAETALVTAETAARVVTWQDRCHGQYRRGYRPDLTLARGSGPPGATGPKNHWRSACLIPAHYTLC